MRGSVGRGLKAKGSQHDLAGNSLPCCFLAGEQRRGLGRYGWTDRSHERIEAKRWVQGHHHPRSDGQGVLWRWPEDVWEGMKLEFPSKVARPDRHPYTYQVGGRGEGEGSLWGPPRGLLRPPCSKHRSLGPQESGTPLEANEATELSGWLRVFRVKGRASTGVRGEVQVPGAHGSHTGVNTTGLGKIAPWLKKQTARTQSIELKGLRVLQGSCKPLRPQL